MKAISLRQPYAWLTVAGHKLVEFRNRSSSFRGECYIHASSTVDRGAFIWIARHLPKEVIKNYMVNGLPNPGMFVTGCIIGKVTVVACMTFDQALEQYPDNIWLLATRGSLGKRAFILEKPVMFNREDRIPCRGKIFPLFFDPEINK